MKIYPIGVLIPALGSKLPNRPSVTPSKSGLSGFAIVKYPPRAALPIVSAPLLISLKSKGMVKSVVCANSLPFTVSILVSLPKSAGKLSKLSAPNCL